MVQGKENYHRVLTVNYSDASGMSGIQADIKTCAALSCYALSAVTAVAAQNTQSVTGLLEVPAEFVEQQLMHLVQDINIDVVKIGMLHSVDTIDAIARALEHLCVAHIVLDPVMLAFDESVLLQEGSEPYLIKRLFPLATLVTPNIYEAQRLANIPIDDTKSMILAATRLLELGANAVLIKGGHLRSPKASDCLLTRDNPQDVQWFETPRIYTANDTGSGCTLSAAIAAHLAKGESLTNAVAKAKEYITHTLEAGSHYELGNGHGPVQHFYAQTRVQ